MNSEVLHQSANTLISAFEDLDFSSADRAVYATERLIEELGGRPSIVKQTSPPYAAFYLLALYIREKERS